MLQRYNFFLKHATITYIKSIEKYISNSTIIPYGINMSKITFAARPRFRREVKGKEHFSLRSKPFYVVARGLGGYYT